MPDRDPGLKFNGVLLRPDQVVPGMTVAIALQGRQNFEVDGDGNPLVLKVLIGGIPVGRRLYPATPEGLVISLVSARISDVRPELRLMPIEIFSPGDAPAKRKFAVFSGGEHWRNEGSLSPVIVRKDRRDRFISSDPGGISFGLHRGKRSEGECQLPADAILVPVDTPKTRVRAVR